MKLKNLISLPPIEKISSNFPVGKKLALMERNKVIREIGEIEVDDQIILVGKK